MSLRLLDFFMGLFTGVLVGLIGQCLTLLVLEPFREIRRVRNKTAFALNFYANAYANPRSSHSAPIAEHEWPLGSEASKTLRECGSELMVVSSSHVLRIPFIKQLLPSASSMKSASRLLIRLSNSIFSGDAVENTEVREKIQKLLRLN